MCSKWDIGRKEWDKLLLNAHNIIPITERRGRDVDLKLLDLYLRKKNDDALFWHNFWSIVLTSMIVLLTAVNIWLTFYKK